MAPRSRGRKKSTILKDKEKFSWEAAATTVFREMRTKKIEKWDVCYVGWGGIDVTEVTDWGPELELSEVVVESIERKILDWAIKNDPGWQDSAFARGFARFRLKNKSVQLYHTEMIEVAIRKPAVTVYKPNNKHDRQRTLDGNNAEANQRGSSAVVREKIGHARIELPWEAAVFAVFKVMHAKKVEQCEFAYHGWGDSGDITGWVGKFEVSKEVKKVIEGKLLELLGRHFPGWEIDSGSEGFLRFTLKNMRVQLIHDDLIETWKRQRPVIMYCSNQSRAG